MGKRAFIPRVDLHMIAHGGQQATSSLAIPTPKQQSRRTGEPLQLGGDQLALATRADAQTVLPYRVAQPAVALAAGATDASRANALAVYNERTYAATTNKSRDSTLRTWYRIHESWFGRDIPVLPLDADKIRAVVASMIVARYRSAENYICRAKDHHIEMGYPWSELLSREQRRATAAAQRGLGPAHQCLEMKLDLAYSVLGDSRRCQELPSGAPVGFKNYFVIAMFFILRENEASLMLVESVTISLEARCVEILLPASKTDPRALSTTRRWFCTCKVAGAYLACPFCSAVEQMDLLYELFSDEDNVLPSGLPFFPTSGGQTCDKGDIIAAVLKVAEMTGQPTRQADGRNAYGGHVFRISGCRHLYRCGVGIEILKLLARWESSVVLRYVKDVPLERLHSTYIEGSKALANRSSSSGSSMNCTVDTPAGHSWQGTAADKQRVSLAALEDFASGQLLAIRQHAADECRKLEVIAESFHSSRDALDHNLSCLAYIVNDNGRGAVHINASDVASHPATWKTACGWFYGKSAFSRSQDASSFPRERLCHRCFRMQLDGDTY